ncbi:MAG: hypothetical protein MK041_09675 [Aquabacterium sp.]|nr:hypothetical protein [Aquabacterium sp.]
MADRNLSQEAHLWYTLTSPPYIAQAEGRLQQALEFMRERVIKHPFIADYAPVPHWVGAMQDLLDRFKGALTILQHGEFGPMISWCSRMGDIPRGLAESNLDWLSEADQKEFTAQLDCTYSVCSDFLSALAMSQAFSYAGFKDGTADWRHDMPDDTGIAADWIARYYEETIFPTLPEQIPEYAPDFSVSCKTGEIVPWTGVWVPSTGMGTAALAFARQGVQIMQPAYEVAEVSEGGNPERYELVDCTWHPVKQTGRMIAHPVLQALQQQSEIRRRCEAGERCPREGWWFTPASSGGRRHFKLGEVMPAVGGDYGQTIWQWDEHQP